MLKERTMIQQLYKKYFLLLLLPIIFLSCRLGKEYQRPELELPQEFGRVSYADTSSIADIKWKSFFANPALQELIDTGLAYNHDMLVALKRIDIAQKQVWQSKALLLPQAGIQVAGQVSRPSDNSLSGISIKNFLGKSYVESYTAAVNVSWEADIWGKIRAQKDIVLTDYLRTAEAAKAVQTQIIADIAQGYFNLLTLDLQLDIARQNVVLSDSFLVATRYLKDAGLTNALAVQGAQAQKQAIELLVPQLEQSIALQENALQVLTGQLPGRLDRQVTLADFPVPETLAAGLPVAMVSRRPDVRSSELSLVIANSQIGIAQANMYPSLMIGVGGGLESFIASNWFSLPGSLFGLAAGSLTQPLFQRRQLKAEFEISKLEREQAVIEFRQSVLRATGEVSDALVQSDKLKQQRLIAIGLVDTLQHAVFNAQLLFKSDMANYLEVLTARRNAIEAELNLAAIRRQELIAMVDLYRALGGGWQ